MVQRRRDPVVRLTYSPPVNRTAKGPGAERGMSDLAMNERAWALADQMAERRAELRVAVHTLESGARVVDAGVGVAGGLAAGLALAEVCMGGLGHVELIPLIVGTEAWSG